MLHDPTLARAQADARDESPQLQRDGYCILRGALPTATLERLDADLAEPFAQTPFCEGGFYGARTQRFGRLLSRSPVTDALVRHPAIMALADQVLLPWCDTIQLNLTQAIALHPGALPQLPHRDQDMWRGALGETEYLLNVMWPLTDYTAANGATIVWPGSHGRAALEPEPDQAPITAEMRPGGSIRPITAAPVMDLPAPDSPTTPRISPGAMSKDTSSSTCTGPL